MVAVLVYDHGDAFHGRAVWQVPEGRVRRRISQKRRDGIGGARRVAFLKSRIAKAGQEIVTKAVARAGGYSHRAKALRRDHRARRRHHAGPARYPVLPSDVITVPKRFF